MTRMHATGNLPLFFEGVRYDLEWRNYTADLDFWTRQACKYGGPVLDLACGTGRVALHLARAGYRVAGIDASESLLREARRKCLRQKLAVQWLDRDIRGFELGIRFPLVILPFNSISSLIEAKDLEACFACVKRHLSAQGKFVIDCINPRLEILSRDPEGRFPYTRYPAPNGRGMIEVTESSYYDTSRQINHVRLYHKMPHEGGEFVEEMAARMFFPQEINSLLRYNGFLIKAKYGGYDECAFDSQSQRQLVVCSVPG